MSLNIVPALAAMLGHVDVSQVVYWKHAVKALIELVAEEKVRILS